MRVINRKTMGDGPGFWAIFEYVFGIFYFLSVVMLKTKCANQSEKKFRCVNSIVSLPVHNGKGVSFTAVTF